jgi:hypothetical protein
MPGGKLSPDVVRRITRAERALELRIDGYSFRAIAETIRNEFLDFPNYNMNSAYQDINYCIKVANKEIGDSVQNMRAVELKRLDKYLTCLNPGIEEGNTFSIATAMKVVEQRSKLLGLYAPVEIKVHELASKKIEEQLTQLFDRINTDNEIPDWCKQRLFAIAEGITEPLNSSSELATTQ